MSSLNQEMTTSANPSVSLPAQITLPLIILLFALFVIVVVLYLRSKGYTGTSVGSSRSRRLVFAPHEPARPRLALDQSILNSLPVTIFHSKDLNDDDPLDCAVCLCELADGEEVRLLPQCKHGFHVECIDMWFHSNNTCPLCRCAVTSSDDTTAKEAALEMAIQPLEVVTESGVSSNEGSSCYAGPSSSSATSRKRKEVVLAIDVPSRVVGGFPGLSTPLSSTKVPSDSPLPTSRLLEEMKSPAMGRIMSLKRMLSRGSFKGAGSSYSTVSPMGCDIERGGIADSKYQ